MTAPSSAAPSTTLRGRWLFAARALWISVYVLTVGFFLFALPAGYEGLVEASRGAESVLRDVPDTGVEAFLKRALSPGIYPVAVFALEAAISLGLAVVAVLIFWRRSDDWMAMVMSAMFFSYGITATEPLDALKADQPGWGFLVNLQQNLGLGLVLFFFYLFPDGRFAPRALRWLILVWVAWPVTSLFIPDSPFNLANLRPQAILGGLAGVGPAGAEEPWVAALLSYLFVMFWWFSGVFAMWYGYARVLDQVQRRQSRLVIISATAAILGYGAFALPRVVVPALREPGIPNVVYNLLGVPLFLIVIFVWMLSIGFSILRYQLFDISLIVNRALVYGSLTATLVLVYVGGVVSLQYFFRALTGQGSTLAIVASTLAIAALFGPLRRRIQGAVDRRFYRRKYDAVKTLEVFSAKLRNETDLDRLEDELILVVRGTVQPEHVSLWTRPAGNGTGWDG
jgi:hypothetical protein